MAYVETTNRHDVRREAEASRVADGAAGWLLLVAALIAIAVFGATFNALADRPDWSPAGAAWVGIFSGLVVSMPLAIVALGVYLVHALAPPRP